MFDIANLNDNFFSTVNPSEILEIKNLSTEDKIKCFKYFLSSDVITNISVLTNLFLLIDGATDIDESDNSKDNRIFFKDLVEYVDIKLELKDELAKFGIKLIEYYLGVIKGLDVQLAELKVHIPNTYFNILHLVRPILVSKLMGKYLTQIDLSSIKPTHCAEELYNTINNPTSLMTGFLQSILSEVTKNDIDK